MWRSLSALLEILIDFLASLFIFGKLVMIVVVSPHRWW